MAKEEALDGTRLMHQEAPYPQVLAGLVEELRYWPGWTLTLEDIDRGQGSKGLTLCILVDTLDAYDHTSRQQTMHYFPVPPAAYDRRSWRRWLFNRIGDVDTHERMEAFTTGTSKPYAPSHGPGNDPYMVREVGTVEDQRESYRGGVNPPAIGPALARELEGYRGRWVAVHSQRVIFAGDNAATVAAHAEDAGHPPGSYLLLRVPKALAAFLGIGQQHDG